MLVKRSLIILMITFLTLIGSGCFLQPVKEIVREVSVVDYNRMPPLRLGKSVMIEAWIKNPETGKWELLGPVMAPAGSLLKGSKPLKDIKDVLKEETDG